MTALNFKRLAASKLGLPEEPFYRCALAVGHAHGVVEPGLRSVYRFDAAAKAETVLLASTRAAGAKAEPTDMLATLRESGIVACLANLIELAEAGESSHLAESGFTIDADGRVRWAYAARFERMEIEIVAQDFGGAPIGRTFTVSGSALAEALA